MASIYRVHDPNEMIEGPCNAWHYAYPAAAILLGHNCERTSITIRQLMEKLPDVDPVDWFTVGCTGYWDPTGKGDNSPSFGKTKDGVGRDVFLLGDCVAMRRYNEGTTFIWYRRPKNGGGSWEHSIAGPEDWDRWTNQVDSHVLDHATNTRK